MPTSGRSSASFQSRTAAFPSTTSLSNETTFQSVIPTLQARAQPGGAYLGVGPEQNFTYIAALQPKIAFIIDIRRQNLVEHLMYKALFELSDRSSGIRVAPVLAKTAIRTRDGLYRGSIVPGI